MEYVATCLQQHREKEDADDAEHRADRLQDTEGCAGRWMMRKWIDMKNVMEMAAAGRTRQQKRA
ncbi:MAG: hypothetical protein SPH33_06525 [Atopobiaceae bacterium]|nr:hypothetical protein [Atopobiaceae bacterium]